MPGAGMVQNDWFNNLTNPTTQQPAAPTRQYGSPNTFTTAANQQAQDYDTIMGMYKNLAAKQAQNPIVAGKAEFNSVAPQTTNYSEDYRMKGGLNNLQDLSQTGGYSQSGIADLRARAVAPVRSIYASANRNLNRARGLSGGYSPNFGALTAKMAREMSDQIANKLTDVNAGIAQNVASNRLQVAPQYAAAGANANAARMANEQQNANTVNQTNQFNSAGQADTSKFNASAFMNAQRTNRGNELGAIQGMTNLYGTTPALTSLFGQQVANANQMGQNQQQLDNNRLNSLLAGAR
jgi:hypothetical protein